MGNPDFSIIIPCYNQSHFLEDCFNSLFIQEAKSWEAILVNDGSSDQTESIGRNFAKRDSRVRYIKQENQGLSAARNTGMKIAKGELLLFLDADDWLELNCLKNYSRVISSNPEVTILRCGYSYWDKPSGRRFHSHLPCSIDNIYPSVLTHNIGPCHSILIRREFAESLGGFDISLKSCEDWDFWIRAGKMGAKIYTIPEFLVGYRYVPTSMSRNPRVMYDSLTEVSRRAGIPDHRLPKDASYNHAVDLDYSNIQKKHLIRMLGVMLHQGKAKEAGDWYSKEKKAWNWDEEDTDWMGLSTYLSWGYFFQPNQIEELLTDTTKDLTDFFSQLGYSKNKIKKLNRMIFEPQLKRRNHQRFGRLFGAVLNKLNWY